MEQNNNPVFNIPAPTVLQMGNMLDLTNEQIKDVQHNCKCRNEDFEITFGGWIRTLEWIGMDSFILTIQQVA